MEAAEIRDLLETKAEEYNQPGFIKDDPICIPHLFTKKQDIEIAGFFAAMLAWGQRKTIINKCRELIGMMDNTPFDFIKNHQDSDLKSFLSFKHRTFNATDTLYFLEFFKQFYAENESLEMAFSKHISAEETNVEQGLRGFHDIFFSLPDFPERTKKHIATPARKSACKRLNMYLRWMVRNDEKGVDFGIWNTIKPSQLICPLDVHVERVGKALGLLHRKPTDWRAATELTGNLKKINPDDPVRYDFALFGLGLEGFK
ncbi:TIGR02757 family protein [Flammeovirgaceae bacterium SG7u.111]|nr:TIGR02757 family protein [Flammeovirgaceae bacterium SG7u.132]WPO34673.1 TIGR02757 family protein [Flammeovirgaceae bacterium SG7u.111]